MASYISNFQDSVTKTVSSVQNAYNQIQPYISKIQQFSFIISNPNMSDKDKSNAIIDFIMTIYRANGYKLQ